MYLKSIGFLVSSASLVSAQGDGNNNGIFNAKCLYDHTFNDDPIMMPGKIGVAMQHDFFGNRYTNGMTTADDLYNLKDTTCENKADHTGYWAPALRLPDNRTILPKLLKTYYDGSAFPSPNFYHVRGFPPGIQVLAGNHTGDSPNQFVQFICTGGGYMNRIPTACVPDPVKGTQFDISVHFPTCWDGVNLNPSIHTTGYNNMAYPSAETGECPEAYPVRLPRMRFNMEYHVGNVVDFTDVQLSLDPILGPDGKPVEYLWGSLYTGHGDFFSGWEAPAINYGAEYCINANLSCSNTYPYNYAIALADATLDGSDADTNFGEEPSLDLYYQQDYQKVAIMKFNIPEAPALPSMQYFIQLYGAALEPPAAMIYFHYLDDDSVEWEEDTVTYNNAPAYNATTVSPMYVDQSVKYRRANVTDYVHYLQAKGQWKFSVVLEANKAIHYTFESREASHPPMLVAVALEPIPDVSSEENGYFSQSWYEQEQAKNLRGSS